MVTSRAAVWVSLFVSVLQLCALIAAASMTGSAALATQSATGAADVACSVFLLIGVISSVREPDLRHPLGYGRERFFWSFLAAIGIFVGGFGAALVETLRTVRDPHPVGSFVIGYGVLGVLVLLDVVTLVAGLRPLRRRAAERGTTTVGLLWRGTDPAVATVVLTSVAGIVGGCLAALGLVGRELTGSPVPDAVASGLIGLVLLATSVVLLHANRELLTGRGLPSAQIAQMTHVIASQPGVEAVPDLFAVVVGPMSVIVDADVVFADALDVPTLERAIVAAASALRARWPTVGYVYLNPVAQRRERHARPVAPPQLGQLQGTPRSGTEERPGVGVLVSTDLSSGHSQIEDASWGSGCRGDTSPGVGEASARRSEGQIDRGSDQHQQQPDRSHHHPPS